MIYDVCIIGAGPSGIAAAMRSIDLGKKVLLIDKALEKSDNLTTSPLLFI